MLGVSSFLAKKNAARSSSRAADSQLFLFEVQGHAIEYDVNANGLETAENAGNFTSFFEQAPFLKSLLQNAHGRIAEKAMDSDLNALSQIPIEFFDLITFKQNDF